MSGRGVLDMDMASLGRVAGEGWRWWVAELAEMVPTRMRTAGSRRQAGVAFDVETSALRPDGARMPVRGEVRLSRALALVRRIERAGVRARDVPALLSFERDRIMPLPPALMLVAGRLVAPGAIEVVGLPIERARAVADAVASAGIAPVRLPLADGPADSPDSVDLLPAFVEAGLLVSSASRATPWWALVGFLLFLNVAVLIWRDVASVEQLRETVAAQQPGVDVARRIEGRLARTGALAARTRQARAAREPAAMLAAVATALPNGAWVERLTWEEGRLRLTGYRPANVDVAGALRRAPGFADVRNANAEQAATVVLGQPFDVSARVGGR